MSTSRREVIQGAGALATGAGLAINFTSAAQAQPGAAFDINSVFATFMRDLGGGPADGGGSVTFTGQDPIVRSHFRIGACMAVPAMAAAVGAAAVWRERTGQGQDARVDLREAVYNTMPLIALIMMKKRALGLFDAEDPIPESFTFKPTVNGLLPQAPLLWGNPLSFASFQTKDARWVTPTGLYPQHLNGFLNIVKASPSKEAITAAIKTWNAADLDEAVAKAGMVMGVHRTAAEWAQQPEGMHLATRPVIDIVKIGDGPPVPFKPQPSQPLSGVKVLSLTHVIAGSTAARTLAENGADVLHIARDQAFEHEAIVIDVNVGMRSSFVDLRNPAQKQNFEAVLLPQADVFIEGFRGRSMERLGFGVEQVAARRPGIIYCSVRCYSWDGPWKDRAGFDMEALTVSGFTLAEGAGQRPRFPPTMVLNDYIAGYLGAAGIISALRRRAREGGSYHVRISLTRAAMWFASLGRFPDTNFDATLPDHQMIDPETLQAQTPYGEVRRLAPQVKLSKTPGRWRSPLVAVRGGDRQSWEA
ncbi:CoA transferase [Phenylobacterium sp.]|jgi:crotonobetainyl-CoA:carnitine CoA-transferase CaiB-like acyl-CoA transferase|uniref:CoA transferase n=1 Tax=Phenylobacterium sp. TaxID=1871053 RepID=UPI002F4151DD